MIKSGWFPKIGVSQTVAALLVQCLVSLEAVRAQPVLAVQQFLKRSPASIASREIVQIRGVVTAVWGDRNFFVQDDTGGLFAIRDRDAQVQVHDSVLLTGYAVGGGSTPHLKVSEVEVLGRGFNPNPLELTVETPPSQALDARLVRLRGAVTTARVAPQGKTIEVEAFGVQIPVEYAGKPETTRWPSVGAEDIVSVTGVLSVRGSGDSSPHPFRIIVGSRNDVAFVSGPVWWKRIRVREVAFVGALLVLIAFGWGLFLKRKVRRQSAEIGARYDREAALERRYRELVENATDVVLTHDLDGRITSINPAATELLGWRDTEVVGRSIEELMAPDEAHIAGGLVRPENRPAEGGRTFRLSLRARDGRCIPFEVNSWIEKHDGAPVGVQAICRDIRERLRSEDEKANLEVKMRDTQKLESLGILAGGIAHDFNNLLTAVIGNSNLARLETPTDSRVYKSLEEIEFAAERAADLCSQMLAYSGQGRMATSRAILSTLILECVELLQASVTKRARLDLQLAEQLPPVQGDPAQLRQIIVNLVINAGEALGDGGGTVTVRTSTLRAEASWLTDAQVVPEIWEGDHVLLEVSDTGAGMNPEMISRIFEPFFTTKFTGRGLGLAAVLGIVRGHRGALKVTSKVGQGTTFQLALPAIGVPRESSDSSEGALPLLQGTVLVVDDEESVRRTVGRSLERMGCKVLVAEDGAVAVDRLRTSLRPIDLVLLDLSMPKMDGVQTLRELRRLCPDLPILLMSGFAATHALARFGEHQLSGFLQKPFNVKQLRALAQPILDRSPELALDC
jgi:PAS domain S-box-containing protein